MSELPFFIEPYPGELLYSWICRLARANGLPLKIFTDAYLGTKHTNGIKYDVRSDFPRIYDWGGLTGGMTEAYLAVSTLAFESVAIKPPTLAGYVNSIFQPLGMPNDSLKVLFTDVKVCPVCIEEDRERYGEPYLHRSHQMTGVCTCHKHNVPLLVYNRRKPTRDGSSGPVDKFHACDFEPDDYIEIDDILKDNEAYTRYAQAVLEASIVTDSARVADIIRERIQELGYGPPEGYARLMQDYRDSSHAGLISETRLNHFINTVIRKGGATDAVETVAVLTFLFPNPDDFTARLKQRGTAFREYICPVCGRTYCTATGNEWICPDCSRFASPQEKFSRLVDVVGEGKYIPLTEFEKLDEKILFKHSACGKESLISARGFLYSGSRCPCQTFNAPKDYTEAFEQIPGFRFMGVPEGSPPHTVTILHEACGKEFDRGFHNFIKKPRCPYCAPRYEVRGTRGNLIDEKHGVPAQSDIKFFPGLVKDLVGDEYTVLGKPDGSQTSYLIRHNVCGREHVYETKRFLNGMRCPYCRQPEKRVNIEEQLDSYGKGRYVLTEYSTSECEVYDRLAGNMVRMKRNLLLQEMRRSTPSVILPPCSDPDPGWVRYWDFMYGLLLECVKETGSIPKRGLYNGAPLGQWVAEQRKCWKEGSLPKKHERLLSEAGVLTRAGSRNACIDYDKEWERRFSEYIRYVKKTGSLYVSAKTVFHGENLGMWVTRQRVLGRLGDLPAERMEKLLKVDPDFFSKEAMKERVRQHRMSKK